MQLVWTKNIKDPEAKVRFENSLVGSRQVLDRLKEILSEIETTDLDRSEMEPKSYESPSWAFRQAHKNGFRQAIHLIDKIITIEPRDPQ